MIKDLFKARAQSIVKVIILKNIIVNIKNKYLAIFVLKLVCILYKPMS